MMLQLGITIMLILGLVAGGVWLVIGRPFVARWRAESRLEAEMRRQKARTDAARKTAESELAETLHEYEPMHNPEEETQENSTK